MHEYKIKDCCWQREHYCWQCQIDYESRYLVPSLGWMHIDANGGRRVKWKREPWMDRLGWEEADS